MNQGILRRPSAALRLVAAGLLAAAPLAHAEINGISGYSTSDTNCSDCHVPAGSFNYSAQILGVTLADLGDSPSFNFRMLGSNASVGGFNLSSQTAGVTLSPGTGQILENSELTHNSPQAADGGDDFIWGFSATMPTSPTTVTLSGCGNPANGDGTSGGDGPRVCDTHQISVQEINDAPSFTKGANQFDLEDDGFEFISGWATNIDDGDPHSTQTVSFEITSNNNPGLFSVQPAVSNSGNLSYTLAANANGSATVFVRAVDNGGTANGGDNNSDAQSFTINVTAVNDEPSFTKGADVTVSEDSGAYTENAWATNINDGDPETSQTLSFNVSNDNNGLFASQPSIGATGQLTFTPAANANGSATVTVSLSDNGGTANGGDDTSPSQTFEITVNAVNDTPSFTKGPDVTVAEDSGAASVSNWATNIDDGDPELSQTLTFNIVNNTNAALFAVAPAVSSTGTLSFTPAADAVGSATITLNLSDNGGGANTSANQSFVINVTGVNDAPRFTKGADETVAEDAGAQSVPGWASNIDDGDDDATQALTFNITGNTNPGLFAAGPSVASNGTLSYTPAANANGTATITLTLSDDGGTAGGGSDTSAPQSFDVTVTAVNDAPVFTKGADESVNENAGAQTVAGWATGIDDGDPELSQALTFNITGNTNSGLFAAGPAVASNGTLTYTPATDAVGTATITLTLSDDGGTANGGVDTSAAQSFSITVNGVNAAPSFTVGANQTVAEDAGAQTVADWATNIDDGDDEVTQALTFSITANDNAALFAAGPAVSSAGVLSYTPADNAFGTANLSLVLMDNGGTANGGSDTSAPQNFSITVTAVNDDPVADADAFTVDEDSSGNALDVLDGDTDVENDTLTITAVGPRSNGGSVTITGGGTGLSYSPAANHAGNETFSYTISDGNGGSDTATVTMTINNLPDDPIAVNDVAGVAEDSSDNPIDVLANDSDPDQVVPGETLTVTALGATSDGGTVSIDGAGPDNRVLYTPAPSFAGTETFSYTVTDSTGRTDTATVTVNVSNDNDVPVAVNDSFTVDEDSSDNGLDVLANDTDDDTGDTREITTVGATNNGGTVTLSASGVDNTLLYTPAADFVGTETFTYTMRDAAGATSTATVTVTVQNINDAPVAVNDTGTVAEDAAATDFDVVANDTDIDGDTLSLSAVGTPSDGGTAVISGGQLRYTPAANFNGTETIAYTVADGNTGTDTGTLTITVTAVNDDPVAIDDTATVDEDSGATLIAVLANDTDVDTGDTLSLDSVTTPDNGGSAVIAGDQVQYTPAADFVGTETFGYTISDAAGRPASATVTVTVNNVNDAPVAADDAFTVDEDSSSNALDVLANDADIDAGDAVQITAVGTPSAGGAVTITGGGTGLSYTPAADFAGTETVSYTIADNAGLTDTATVTLTVSNLNDAPVAVDDTAGVTEDSSDNVLDLLANDTDVDTGDSLRITALGALSDGGSATIGAGGSQVLYSPAADFAGTETFTYTIADDAGLTDTASVSVIVSNENDAPVAVDDTATVDEDSVDNVVAVLANDTDVDADDTRRIISVDTPSAGGSARLSDNTVDNTLLYSPAADFVGTETVGYTMTDAFGATSSATLTLTVNNVNDAPVGVDDTGTAVEDSTGNRYDVLANDTDIDADDVLRIVSVGTPSDGGTASIVEGQIEYAPAADFNGLASIAYTVADAADATDTATLLVTVSAVNDAPVIASDPVTLVNDTEQYQYTLAVTDPDDANNGFDLNFSLLQAPEGMAVSTTGVISWQPPVAGAGDYPVSVQVADGGEDGALADVQDWVIIVLSPDSDDDGMPDSYEDANGFDRNDPSDAAADRDGDGISNLDEFLGGTNPDVDDNAPVVTPPDDLSLDATGYFTPVDLGRATALDALDGELFPTADLTGPFRPGVIIVTWSATDVAGNTGTATQEIRIRPIVTMAVSQTTGEGVTVDVVVQTNGWTPSGQATVNYTVSGTASEADHDARSGTATIDNDVPAVIPVQIIDDGTTEADETVVLTIDSIEGAVLGSRRSHTITIVDRNVAPRVGLAVTQDGQPRTTVYQDGGPVTVRATVTDPNPGDTATLNWTGTEPSILPPVEDGVVFSFDPADLAPGSYPVVATASDSGGASSTARQRFAVQASAPVLSGGADTDGDGVPDATEGLGDIDEDGVPDYLDANNAAELLADQRNAPGSTRSLETEPGLRLVAGGTAIDEQRFGALVAGNSLPEDTGMERFGGLYDFEVRGLTPGEAATVVVPLQAGIPPQARYRKYSELGGWADFVETGADALSTAPRSDGQCPGLSSDAWVPGLNAFHACVRLTLSDGGPNDADGVADGVIRDPGGPGVPSSVNAPAPEPSENIGGSGRLGVLLLALLAGLGVTRRGQRPAQTGGWR